MTTSLANAPALSRLRAVWMDRLRASLILLVILYHAAITHGASGSWFFKATGATNLETGQRILGGRFILGPLWFPVALLAFSVVLVLRSGRGRAS